MKDAIGSRTTDKQLAVSQLLDLARAYEYVSKSIYLLVEDIRRHETDREHHPCHTCLQIALRANKHQDKTAPFRRRVLTRWSRHLRIEDPHVATAPGKPRNKRKTV